MVRQALLGGKKAYYFPVTTDLYRDEQTGLISLSQVNDPLDGKVVHTDWLVLKPASGLAIYSQFAVLILWGSVTVSSILFCFVWGIRKFQGKISGKSTIRIRLWPLLAGMAAVSFLLLFMEGSSNPLKHFGEPSVFSVGIMLSSILFVLFTALGAYTSIIERNTKMNQGTYWYSTFSSLIHLIVSVYLLFYGVIGVMTWA